MSAAKKEECILSKYPWCGTRRVTKAKKANDETPLGERDVRSGDPFEDVSARLPHQQWHAE
jgi:hypothetical protein